MRRALTVAIKSRPVPFCNSSDTSKTTILSIYRSRNITLPIMAAADIRALAKNNEFVPPLSFHKRPMADSAQLI